MSADAGRINLNAVPVVQTPANPAAGADINIPIGGTPRSIVALTATLVTSATVANRFPSLVVTDSLGHILAESSTPNAQAASVTQSWCWAVGAPVIITAPFLMPWPAGLIVPVNGIIKTVTAGIQVGDQWSLTVLTLAG